MSPKEALEAEQKFDVDEETSVPDLLAIDGVERVGDPVEHQLEAVYFDTGGMALATRRMTLRRRAGGSDAGWHLKIPAGIDTRQEIRAPLGQPEVVPEELLTRLLVHTRGEGLVPITRMRTRRTTYRLYGSADVHLADFVDDEVQAEALGPTKAVRQWREWEVELVNGHEELFAAVEEVLTRAGATRSEHRSKLARALGDTWPSATAPDIPKPHPKGPARDVVTSYLAEQVRELTTQDPRVRRGEDESIHDMRSATRRTRSVLTTYRSLFSKGAVSRLNAELRWLGRVLGPARDAEVMLDRIRKQLREEASDAANSAVPARIEDELTASYNTKYKRMLETLGTDRYYRLLDYLEDFRDNPPAKPPASKPAGKVSAKLTDKAAKRLRKAQIAVDNATGKDRDTALHQVRKAAKRLRYAAEAVREIHGKPATTLEGEAHDLQRILGEHQDSVVAKALLVRMGGDGASEHDGGVYGRLIAAEERNAEDSEAAYREARAAQGTTRLRKKAQAGQKTQARK